jgi:sec-independent protein translocase protein TatA
MTHLSSPLAALPGGWEWFVVLFIFLLLFGRRLPGIARSLGQGLSEFKKGLSEPAKPGGDDDDRPPARDREPARDDATRDQPSRKAPATDRERT